MTAATAWAPVNIALVKHWGYRGGGRGGLPARSSLSITLEHGATTTVEWVSGREEHHLCVDGWVLTPRSGAKAAASHRLLDRIRDRAGLEGHGAVVTSRSAVPVSGGMASSAAGAAALTEAALRAAGLREEVTEDELVRWCAMAESISGVRSLRGGLVRLEVQDDRMQLADVATSLDLALVSCLVESRPKRVSSAEGHAVVTTSPYWEVFEALADVHIDGMVRALGDGRFEELGALVEADALAMHGVMLTSRPSIVYATDDAWSVWRQVVDWRAEGLLGYCTLDAGPNPHVLCRREDVEPIARRLAALPEVRRIWTSRVHPIGAHGVPGPASARDCAG